MNELRTSEYPTRYVAFDNPRTLVIAKNPEERGGFEAMVYDAPIANTVHSGIEDGVYGEVSSYQGRYWIVQVHATKPTRFRSQNSWKERTDSLTPAKETLKRLIAKANSWMCDTTIIHRRRKQRRLLYSPNSARK